MEAFKYGIFDLFVYTIPGAFFLFCLLGINSFDIYNPGTMFNSSIFDKEVSILGILISIIVSYVIGFIINTFGQFFFKFSLWIKKIIVNILNKKLSQSVHAGKRTDKYVLVREKSKENQKYIELWNVMKNFTSSISFSLFILSLYYFNKFTAFGVFPLIVLITISFFVINRAMVFDRWANNDLDAAYKSVVK